MEQLWLSQVACFRRHSPSGIGQSQNKRIAKITLDRQWLEASKASQSVDMLQWRRVAQSFGQGVKQTLGSGRRHPRLRASALLRGQVDDAPQDLVAALQASSTDYAQSVMNLDSMTDALGTTVMSQLSDRTDMLLAAAATARDSLSKLEAACEAFSVWKVDSVAAKSAVKKRTVFKLVQFIKPFERGGVPQHMARFMVHAGMLPKPPGADEWPAFLDSSFPAVTAASDMSLLGQSSVWGLPLRFDLSGQLPSGSEIPTL